MAEAHNAAQVRRAVVEIWNQGELGVADVLFASDYINHAGLIPDLIRGPEAIKIGVAFYRTAFPHFQITMDELTAKRDAVVLRWTARSGTPQGTLTGMLVCRFADGQIAESWMQWNQASVLTQLGLNPACGTL
ncbi:MAG: ester cyclase [Roseiflexaceae bacterium]